VVLIYHITPPLPPEKIEFPDSYLVSMKTLNLNKGRITLLADLTSLFQSHSGLNSRTQCPSQRLFLSFVLLLHSFFLSRVVTLKPPYQSYLFPQWYSDLLQSSSSYQKTGHLTMFYFSCMVPPWVQHTLGDFICPLIQL
jgi:hypothetical protein